MIVSVDPGDSVGVALWSEQGAILENWKVDRGGFSYWLRHEKRPISRIIAEDFHLDHRAGKQTGSNVPAALVLGGIEMYAAIHDIPITRQENRILRITAMHANVMLPKGHIPDDVAAFLHGFRYFIEAGVLAGEVQVVD